MDARNAFFVIIYVQSSAHINLHKCRGMIIAVFVDIELIRKVTLKDI